MKKNQSCLAKAAKHDNRNSGQKSAAKDMHRLMDAAEVKDEPGIKDEPQPVGDLATVPARSLDNRDDEQPLAIDDNQSEDEDVEVCSDNDDDAKNEVKDESGEKSGKEEDSTGEREGDGVDDHQDERGHSSDHDARNEASHQNGNIARRTKSIKPNDQNKTVKLHQCTYCEYSTKYTTALNRHLLKHTGQKPFPCDHCDKAFISKQNLKNHMKVHADEFPFHCLVCLLGFDQKNKKMKHESDCKALRYECDLCKKSFGTGKNKLTRHMCTHSGVKQFECTECSKPFIQKHHLKSHMKIHSGLRSFHCSKCRLRFVQQNEMIAHEKKCSRRTFECYVCGKNFGLKKVNLDNHMRTHTGDKPFKCNKCQKKFSQKGQLNSHMLIHSRSLPWKCSICRQGFAKQKQCSAHQRNCSRRGYECFFCGKFFGSSITDLKRHTMTHLGEKPFQCKMCQERFTRKSGLKRHMNRIHNKEL